MSFKVNCDFNIDIEKVKAIAYKEFSKRSYNITCPHCNKDFNAIVGENTCPHCMKIIMLYINTTTKGETMTELTKDADQMVCTLYKVYLERRQNGINKFNAKHFNFNELRSNPAFYEWIDEDIKETIAEIKRAGFGTMYLDGSFMANDQFIVYMENRFKNGISEVVDFITKFL